MCDLSETACTRASCRKGQRTQHRSPRMLPATCSADISPCATASLILSCMPCHLDLAYHSLGHQSTFQSSIQAINQSNNQSIIRTINQSCKQSLIHSIKSSGRQSVNHPITLNVLSVSTRCSEAFNNRPPKKIAAVILWSRMSHTHACLGKSVVNE